MTASSAFHVGDSIPLSISRTGLAVLMLEDSNIGRPGWRILECRVVELLMMINGHTSTSSRSPMPVNLVLTEPIMQHLNAHDITYDGRPLALTDSLNLVLAW